VRDCDHDRVRLDRLALAAHCEALGGVLDGLGAPAQPDVNTRRGERADCRRADYLAERSAVDPDVPRCGIMQQTLLEDERAEPQRRVGGADSECRQRDQVPQVRDCMLALSVTPEPVAKGHIVTFGVDPADRQGPSARRDSLADR
jgi:hypothetical protein